MSPLFASSLPATQPLPLGLPGLPWYPATKEFIPGPAGHPENLIPSVL